MLVPSTITIPQGGTGTVAITTVLVSGETQLLSWSLTGIPQVAPNSGVPLYTSQLFGGVNQPGVLATFGPNPALVATPVTLVLQVKNVIPGTYVMQVVAMGPLETVMETLTLIVTPSTFSF